MERNKETRARESTVIKLVYHNLFYIFISVVLVLFFFGRLFYPQTSLIMIPDFGESDVLHFNLPFKEILSVSLKNKEWPLWTPYLASGFPILAEGQISTFYLPNLVLFRFLPTVIAFNLNLIVSYLLSLWGAFLFAKSLKLSGITCLFSAVTFTFSGFLSVHLNHFNLIQTASLLPFLFWATNLLLKKPSLPYASLFAFFLSQQVFAGHFYIVFITLVGITVFFLGNILISDSSMSGVRQLADRPLPMCLWRILKKSKYLLLGFFLAFCLSAIQLFPTIELVKLSGRASGLSFDTVTSYPYPFKHLITFINPYALGDPADSSYPPYDANWGIFWENTAYVGILPLVLALSSIFFLIPIRSRRGEMTEEIQKKMVYPSCFGLQPAGAAKQIRWVYTDAHSSKRSIKIFLLILFVSLLLVLGKNSPLYLVFSFFPFNLFRVPSKFLLLTTFCLAILSAYSFERILKFLKNKTVFPHLVTIVTKCGSGSEKIPKAYLEYLKACLKCLNVCLIIIIFTLTLLDEYRFSYNYPPISPSSWWTQIPESVHFLKGKEGRVKSIGAPLVWNSIFLEKGWRDISPFVYFRNSLYPNYNTLFSLSNFDINTGGLTPRRLSLLETLTQEVEIDEGNRIASISAAAKNILSLGSAKYLISSYKIIEPSFSLIKKIDPPDKLDLPPIYIFENTKALPRSYISFKTKKVLTVEDLYRELEKEDFLSEKKVLVEDENFILKSQEQTEGEVTIVYEKGTEIYLKSQTSQDGILVLTDTNYPGWTATIDDKPINITNVNLTQRGILLPKGKHIIHFIFKPFYFYLGKKITILAMIIVSLAVPLSRGFFPQKASDSKRPFDYPANRKQN